MSRRGMADETLDGIIFGMKLQNAFDRSPAAQARQSEYFRKLRSAHAVAGTLTDTELIDQLIAHHPAYIRKLLEDQHPSVLRDRYAHTFWKAQP